jgi:hypothetical protein
MSMTYTEKLTVVHCTCGIPYAIPEALYNQAHERGKSIYCPVGHAWHYTESTEQKLKREREKTARVQAQLDQAEASLVAQKGVATKLRKKVARAENGVCPHCNRSFVNLQRHVKTKHPECLA